MISYGCPIPFPSKTMASKRDLGHLKNVPGPRNRTSRVAKGQKQSKQNILKGSGRGVRLSRGDIGSQEGKQAVMNTTNRSRTSRMADLCDEDKAKIGRDTIFLLYFGLLDARIQAEIFYEKQ